MSDPIYYRVIDTNGAPAIVTMQWFDEYGYDQSRFLTWQHFETEAQAQAWMDEQRAQAQYFYHAPPEAIVGILEAAKMARQIFYKQEEKKRQARQREADCWQSANPPAAPYTGLFIED